MENFRKPFVKFRKSKVGSFLVIVIIVLAANVCFPQAMSLHSESLLSKPQMQTKDQRTYLIFIWLGCTVVLLAFLVDTKILREFYLNFDSFSPRAEISPLEIEWHVGRVGFGALCFAMVCSASAALISLNQRNWFRFGIAFLPVILCMIVLRLGDWGFQHVIELPAIH